MPDLDEADIDAQIAQLEAIRQARRAKAEAAARERDREAAKVLVQNTPTKAKPAPADLPAAPSQPKFTVSAPRAEPPHPKRAELPALPSKGNFAAALARRRADDGQDQAERVEVPPDLWFGPGEFGRDPEGGDVWRNIEPNSGIRLSKRAMTHEEVQEHLEDRYYLPPADVYTHASLGRDGATYNLPVDKEWVTIAVVAERSDVRASGGKEGGNADEDEDWEEEEEEARATSKGHLKGKGKHKDQAPPERRAPRKYITLTLVALPDRSLRTKRGADAHFQLLLFEADAIRRRGVVPSYHGGSGGAYEKWSGLPIGTVVAVVSPRILRPLKSGETPHPVTLPLALNPTSAASITVIGHSADLGRCAARTSSGTQCGAWIDTRRDDFCEHHKVEGLKRARASRGEFASATSELEGMYRTENRAGVRSNRGGGEGASYALGGGKVVRTGQRTQATPSSQSKKRRHEDPNEITASLEHLIARGEDRSPGAKYLRAAAEERVGRELAAQGIPRVVAPARRHVYTPATIAKIGYDPGRAPENTSTRAALIAQLMGPVDRTKLVARPREPMAPAQTEEASPDCIDLD